MPSIIGRQHASRRFPSLLWPFHFLGFFAVLFLFFFFTTASASRPRAAIFSQLVVQCLQADTQNFRGAGLVILGPLPCLENQQALSFTHCCSHPHTNRISVVDGRTQRRVTKTRRQMLVFH